MGIPGRRGALTGSRAELALLRELFEKGDINPACHKLQDVEDISKPLKVKPEVQ